MAISSTKDLKKSDPIPQKLYTPKIKNEEKIDLKLYTPKIKNENKIDTIIKPPKLKEDELKTPIYIPEPELYPFPIDLIFPDPTNPIIRDFLIIPNPNEIDVDPSIRPPDPDNPLFNDGINPPDLETIIFDNYTIMLEKLKTLGIPSYAYAIPIKRGFEELVEFNQKYYEINPINNWPFFHSFNADPSPAATRGEDWAKQWKELEESFKHWKNRDDFFWLKIMPYNIELPRDAQGNIRKINYKIPKYRLGRGYLDRGPYMSYKNDTGQWKGVKYVPNPNYKSKTVPANQGWSAEAQEARYEQFKKEMEDFWSGDNWKNIGLEMAKNLGADLLGSMLNFGGYDVGKREGEYSTTSKWIPHIYDYDFTGGLKGKDYSDNALSKFTGSRRSGPGEDFYSWLFTSENSNPYGSKKIIARPSKFKYMYPNNGVTHPINLLNAIGPDFMKHKFDAYLVFYLNDGNIQELTPQIAEERWMTPFQRFIFSHKGFAVRFGSISIPKVSKDDFTSQWLETKVHKPRTSLNFENKASFTFRLDHNLFWLDLIDKLAGHNNTIDQLQHKGAKESSDFQYRNIYHKDKMNNENWKNVINSISNSFSPSYIDRRDNPRKLCLVIKMAHLSDVIHTGTQTRMLPYFIFEDIRILGTNTSISYEREGLGPQDISISFIFKFLSEIHTPNKLGRETFIDHTSNNRFGFGGAWFPLLQAKWDKSIVGKHLPPIYTYEDVLFGTRRKF